jgi:hypothetical protein
MCGFITQGHILMAQKRKCAQLMRKLPLTKKVSKKSLWRIKELRRMMGYQIKKCDPILIGGREYKAVLLYDPNLLNRILKKKVYTAHGQATFQ